MTNSGQNLMKLTAALLFFSASGTMAQPSFNCSKATSEVEEQICSDDALAVLDRRLSVRYDATKDVIGSMEAGREEALNNLRATQRGWIKGRDECWKAKDLSACVEATYLTREAELVTLWMLDTPATVKSYVCNKTQANEISVFFFDTELPGIRLEYGDSIRAGWRVRSGSGSKYELSFGGMFWVKGTEAQFRWEVGQDMACVATE